ncbi:hypothetical protein [uncultured Gammaproteobacteria bacterium]|jgi:hypothetical protein|nr:hypothetical protein [uncultured Gammaproteobacteria bacterium]
MNSMKKKIERLLEKTNKIDDEELSAHFLNYICVLISGYLEVELEKIIKKYQKSEHCKRHECSTNINSMRKIQNAKWCSIRPVFMNIDNTILSKLKGSIEDMEQTISSINNIVNTRHKIAHGKSVTNLTEDNLVKDLNNIDCFINKLQEVFEQL